MSEIHCKKYQSTRHVNAVIPLDFKDINVRSASVSLQRQSVEEPILILNHLLSFFMLSVGKNRLSL